ncbi:MAG: hypothetical protein ACLGH0_08710, partial [Thermoanaerobaculia bacterium]
MKFRTALLLGVCVSSPLLAQSYVYPSKDVASKCESCLVPNVGLPAWPYSTPLVRHVGRYVDSTTTGNVQNLGIRTVRARAIRYAPATNRIYIALGEAVGGYKLDSFFTTKLPQAMTTVNNLHIGGRVGGRLPYEKCALPESLFYAEAPFSGWTTAWIDAQRILSDFDSDDRGYVYIGTIPFGWGIAEDAKNDGTHMAFVAQILDPIAPDSMISLESGGKYYVVISQNPRGGGKHAIYDVTKPAEPVLTVARTKNPEDGIKSWSKYDFSKRLAIIDTLGNIRIFDYDAFLTGGQPRATYSPSPGKSFAAIAFDPLGNLWIAETTSSVGTNVLQRARPSGAGYVRESFNVYGGAFAPEQIDASRGYVIVAGRALLNGVSGRELRLISLGAGIPRLVPLGPFFRNYYDQAPADYADPGTYVGTQA